MLASLLQQAQRVAEHVPPLLLDVERIAQTAMLGLHSRKRSGVGDHFWQFRRYEPGDSIARIDWRQSAKGDKIFIREREYEAAQNVYLWADASGSMRFASTKNLPTKADQARLITLALASLLLRGGEKITWMGANPVTAFGTAGLEKIVAQAEQSYSSPLEGEVRRGGAQQSQTTGLRMAPSPRGTQSNALAESPLHASLEGRGTLSFPPSMPIARQAHIILASDFLTPKDDLIRMMRDYTGRSVRGVLLHILDPIEEDFALKGRVDLQGCEGEDHLLLPNADALRDAYAARMHEHKDFLQTLARNAGWRYAQYVTDEPAHHALLKLYDFLDARV